MGRFVPTLGIVAYSYRQTPGIAKNNFALLLIAKHIVGPACLLEGGHLESLVGSDLFIMLLDPVARFIEKHCVATARHMKVEFVAAHILTRIIEGFKKNLRDKVAGNGVWNNQFVLQIILYHAFVHQHEDWKICKGVQVECLWFFLCHEPEAMTWYQMNMPFSRASADHSP